MADELQFPRSFLWGTATAAHQVEGQNTNNEWWDWEQGPRRIRDGSRSGLACDHYRRFREDFDLLAGLHQNAHRLSLEWSRIEPRPGEFDRAALDHYRQVLEALRLRGIEPLVTLHHFTNPRWLTARGGWEEPAVVDLFGRFVRRVVREYGELVSRWVTINEPVVYAQMGFFEGVWPPGRRSLRLAWRVLRHLLLAHGRAYREIHAGSSQPNTAVGVAHHLRVFDPHRPGRPLDRWLAALSSYLFNRCLTLAQVDGRLRFPFGHGQRLPELAGSADFLGVNYYTRDAIGFQPRQPRLLFGGAYPTANERSVAGWEIYPEGLYRLLKWLQSLGRPIVVTENGVADEGDELRPRFLLRHLAQLHRAIREGVPVQGYFHWSSMDNFEWAEGYRLRFGLIHVDYETQRRTVKPSGWLYADVCARNGISARQVQSYAPELLAAGEPGWSGRLASATIETCRAGGQADACGLGRRDGAGT